MRNPLTRRLITVPATLALTVTLVVLAPVALPLMVIVDLLRLRPRLPLVRGWIFAIAYGVLECAMLVVVAPSWTSMTTMSAQAAGTM